MAMSDWLNVINLPIAVPEGTRPFCTLYQHPAFAIVVIQSYVNIGDVVGENT